jgi:hypothetical protein
METKAKRGAKPPETNHSPYNAVLVALLAIILAYPVYEVVISLKKPSKTTAEIFLEQDYLVNRLNDSLRCVEMEDSIAYNRGVIIRINDKITGLANKILAKQREIGEAIRDGNALDAELKAYSQLTTDLNMEIDHLTEDLIALNAMGAVTPTGTHAKVQNDSLMKLEDIENKLHRQLAIDSFDCN